MRIYNTQEHPLEVGQFFSDEPGYYQPEEFGIRLETVLRTVKKTGLEFEDKDDYGPFLGFEPVCLVPFEPKLIDLTLMNNEQVNWLNNYHRTVEEKVSSELKRQGKTRYGPVSQFEKIC